MTGNGKQRDSMMMHDPLADLSASELDAGDSSADEVLPEPIADGALELGDTLTIQDVTEALERFGGALAMGGRLRIDAGELEQLDAAGLQLLCAAIKDAKSQDMEVEWLGISDRLRRAATLLGVQNALALQSADQESTDE